MKKLSGKFLAFLFCAVFVAPGLLKAQDVSKKQMKQLIDDNIRHAAIQYKLLAQNTPKNVMPRSYDTKDNNKQNR